MEKKNVRAQETIKAKKPKQFRGTKKSKGSKGQKEKVLSHVCLHADALLVSRKKQKTYNL